MLQVKEEAAQRELKMTFHGAKDHLDESMHDYMVFINPSTSDVVRCWGLPCSCAAQRSLAVPSCLAVAPFFSIVASLQRLRSSNWHP